MEEVCIRVSKEIGRIMCGEQMQTRYTHILEMHAWIMGPGFFRSREAK
jgi:hypothetical protein